jgi:hypothetical protein
MYLKNQDWIEQALQGGDVSQQISICDAKHGDMENELFKLFCNAQVNCIAMDGYTAK